MNACLFPGQIARRFEGQPLKLVAAAACACLLGGFGAIAGLVVGLIYYPPTAWAAMVELGAPAAVLGCVLGLLAGAVLDSTRRRRSRGRS
ncbi:MAG: hypothetical protein ACJ72L_09630 [Marmoricola sp.]